MHIWANASKSDRMLKISPEPHQNSLKRHLSQNKWVSVSLSLEKWPGRCPMDDKLLPLPFHMKIKEIRMDLDIPKTG
ncbi:hypothetical protein EJB05_32850, partial [Eragrostis curvula]